MNDKGFFSINYVFLIFLLLIISICFIIYTYNISQSNEDNFINVESRLELDTIADLINQVNSNGAGYSKEIKLPEKIQGKSYLLTIKSNKVILEISSKKAESLIFPISLVSYEKLPISEVKLYNGEKYLISKHEDNKLSILKVN